MRVSSVSITIFCRDVGESLFFLKFPLIGSNTPFGLWYNSISLHRSCALWGKFWAIFLCFHPLADDFTIGLSALIASQPLPTWNGIFCFCFYFCYYLFFHPVSTGLANVPHPRKEQIDVWLSRQNSEINWHFRCASSCAVSFSGRNHVMPDRVQTVPALKRESWTFLSFSNVCRMSIDPNAFSLEISRQRCPLSSNAE